MSDLIDRQDAIIAVRSHRLDINGPKKIVRKSYEDVIRELPSAEPERKKGKWIYKHYVWFCSKCGENPTKGMGYVQGHQELYDFCPKCGADMRDK